MEFVSKLIISGIAMALGLAATGKLASTTMDLALATFEAQNQMISLSSLSHELTAPIKHKKARAFVQ